MNKKQAMIRGYEIAKTTELNGELKLAQEISELKDEYVNLCVSCIHGGDACNAVSNGAEPAICTYSNVGFSCSVIRCNSHKEK